MQSASTSMDSVIDAFKKIANHCHSMHDLLLKDKEHIIKNNIQLLEENNQRKAEVIEQINSLVTHISRNHPEGIWNSLQRNTSPESQKTEELQIIMEDLSAWINECYQHINVNSNIVYSNLDKLKTVWDQILSFQSKNNCTYDQTGQIVK